MHTRSSIKIQFNNKLKDTKIKPEILTLIYQNHEHYYYHQVTLL